MKKILVSSSVLHKAITIATSTPKEEVLLKITKDSLLIENQEISIEQSPPPPDSFEVAYARRKIIILQKVLSVIPEQPIVLLLENDFIFLSEISI